jgi:hypothetical protein
MKETRWKRTCHYVFDVELWWAMWSEAGHRKQIPINRSSGCRHSQK